GNEPVVVDAGLARCVLAARMAIKVAGDDQPHVVACERLVERDELVGDLTVRARHRLGGAGPDESVPRLDGADAARLQDRGHAARARRAAARTSSGRSGISFSCAPTASQTAFATAPAAPIVPPSPTPLTPCTAEGAGDSRCSSAKAGSPAAVGTRKSMSDAF